MSHWDFGRPPDTEHDGAAPHDGTAYEPDPVAWPDGTRTPPGAGQAGMPWPAGFVPQFPGAAAAWPGAQPAEPPPAGPWLPDAWPPGALRADGAGWAAGPDRSQGQGQPPGASWYGDEDEDEDEDDLPYPVTYEREDSPGTELPVSPPTASREAPPWDAPPRETPSREAPSREAPPWDAPSREGPPRAAAPLREPKRPTVPGPRVPADGGGAAGDRHDDDWQAGFADFGEQDGVPGPGWPGPGGPGWPEAAEPGAGEPGAGRPQPGVPDGSAGDGSFDDWAGPGTGQRPAARRRRWALLAGVVAAGAAVGAAAVLLAGGTGGGHAAPDPGASPGGGRADVTSGGGQLGVTPGGSPAATPSSAAPLPSAAAAPLTLAEAKRVLAGYTAANNAANAKRSATELAAIETGASYAVDAGLYRTQQGKAPYPAFSPVQAAYYLPRGEPAAGPRWFVAQVANAFASSPGKVTNREYLLFTQSAPGAPWLDAIEPYLVSGASAPQIAVGADGLATAVSADSAALAVAPGQLAAATAAALDRTATAQGQPAVRITGDLADVSDQKYLQGKLPGGKADDAHAPAAGTAGQEFALRTADGGALVFYADAARLTLTPPPGATFRLTIPGFYSPGQSLSGAVISYLEQFAAYDPPAGAGTPPAVVARYSGITGKG